MGAYYVPSITFIIKNEDVKIRHLYLQFYTIAALITRFDLNLFSLDL